MVGETVSRTSAALVTGDRGYQGAEPHSSPVPPPPPDTHPLPFVNYPQHGTAFGPVRRRCEWPDES